MPRRDWSEAEAQEIGEARKEARRESEPCRYACCADLPVRRDAATFGLALGGAA